MLFGFHKVIYLGHVINKGARPDMAKLAIVVACLQSFLGFASYFCRFVKDIARRTFTFRTLLEKATPWTWGKKEQKVFNDIKRALLQPPTLAHLHTCNKLAATFVHTDGSAADLGTVLLQDSAGVQQVLAYASTRLDEVELPAFIRARMLGGCLDHDEVSAVPLRS